MAIWDWQFDLDSTSVTGNVCAKWPAEVGVFSDSACFFLKTTISSLLAWRYESLGDKPANEFLFGDEYFICRLVASDRVMEHHRLLPEKLSFPFPTKLPVLTAPLSAWNAGKPSTIGVRGITLCRCSIPVTNEVSSFKSGA